MRKSIKFFLWSLSVLCLFLLLTISFLPYFLSTSFGTKILLDLSNDHLVHGKIFIEQINLSWFKGQQIKNIKLEDKNGKTIFMAEYFETDTTLIYLLFGGRNFGRTLLEKPFLYLTQNEKEKKEREKSNKVAKYPLSLLSSGNSLSIRQGTIVIHYEPHPLLKITEIELNKTKDKIEIYAKTAAGQSEGALTVETSLDEKRETNIHIKDFPLAILDSLFQTRLYTEGLGPTLDCTVNFAEKNNHLSLNGSAKSLNLTASIIGYTQDNTFVLNPDSQLDLIITPTFFKQLISEKQRGNWELASKTELTIQIEEGIFPLKKQLKFDDICFKAKANINRAELHHKRVGCYSLNKFDISVASQDNLEIAYQGEIQGKEATKITGNASITSQGEMLFDYTCQGVPVTLLELISAGLEKKVRLAFGSQFDLNGKGTLHSKVLDTNFALSAINSELTGHLHGTLYDSNFELSGVHKVHGNRSKIIGDHINFTMNGTAKLQENYFYIPLLHGHLFNPYFELDMRGHIGEENREFSLEQIQLIAMAHIKKLPLADSETSFQNGILHFQVDGAKNLIIGKAESQVLDGHFQIENFIREEELCFEEANVDFTCNLQNFPLGILTSFISDGTDLTPFFGKTITLTSKGSYSPNQEQKLQVDLNAQGEGFSTSFSATFDKAATIKQNKPSYVYWEITPQRYESIMRLFHVNPEYEPTFTLIRPTHIELNISHFTCPTIASKNIGEFLRQSGFIGDLKIGTTTFRNQETKEAILFQDIEGSITGENFSKEIDLALSGKILAENIPEKHQSDFSFSGQMFNFWTQSGKFNREGCTVKGEMNLSLLPVRQVTGIVPLDDDTREIIQAVLGEFINAKICGEISQLAGPVTVDIKSSNFKAILPLQLQKNAVYLRDYVDAEITLTESVNETLIKDIAPLFIAGLYSEHPLKVYIDPQGFCLPIRPYSLQRVSIPKAVVDIGKICVRNGGQIQSLMQFVNAKEITPDGLMQAWFTPIFLNLQQGIASYKRFDALLATNVHIALWGSINLINDDVDMTLGIAPATLYERFKITGLTKKDLFLVQMRGKTTKLELDWSSAYSRMAWIIARKSAGQLSNILGGILEKLLSSPSEQIPPPTTDPLPWESQYPS